jgi:hypothetical protein
LIYTLGRKSVYEEVFNKIDQSKEYCKKFGKTSTYDGGSVWKMYEEALNYKIKNNLNDFDVYGVVASWKDDTEENEHGNFNNLLRDSRLVRLSDVKGYVNETVS